MCSLFSDIDVQLSHQLFDVIQVWRYLVSYFLRFLQVGSSCLHGLFMLIFWFWLILCSAFYPVCLFSCDVDVQLSHQHFTGQALAFDILKRSQMSRMSSLRILSRRVLPMTYLEVLDLYESSPLLLHLLIGPCSVFHPACSCNVDVQLSHQHFTGHPGGPGMPGFSSFMIFASRLSSILFTWTLHVFLLILAHLLTSWILRISRMSREFYLVMHFRVLISVVLRRRLVMIVSTLVSMT